MENNTGLLNRNLKDSNTYKNQIEKETTNEALATKFPQWDLVPTVGLVARRKVKRK